LQTLKGIFLPFKPGGVYTPLHFDQPQLAQVGHFSSLKLVPQRGQLLT
jgi:hypothetical protein